jgi:hypothetical protein
MSNGVLVACLVLLACPASGQDVMTYHVKHITVLAEDRDVRVLRYAPKRGDRTPMHSHPASVLYVIKGGRIKTTLPDGTAGKHFGIAHRKVDRPLGITDCPRIVSAAEAALAGT